METIEAGIELAGTEVKSAKIGVRLILPKRVCVNQKREVFIKQMNIESPFEQGNIFNRDPLRTENFFFIRKKY